MSSSKAIGDSAESAALEHLKSKGLRLLESNYRCRYGEIDLIMNDNNSVVFIEVRCRSNKRFGNGAESVDFRKQQKLIATAQYYLQQHSRLTDRPCRFDVVSINQANLNKSEPGAKHLEWITDAFQL